MKVLYVNHTAHLSGGELSLLAVLGALPDGVDAVVACPEGELADRARALGVRVRTIRTTAGSLKVHPRHTPAALADMTRAAYSLGQIIGAEQPDVVHANSIRAGLICAPARRRSDAPLLVHVRDCLPPGPLTTLTLSILERSADLLIANSRHTARALSGDAPVRVLHSPVDVERYRPGCLTTLEARRRLGLPMRPPVLGMVAQITPWKGQDDAIRALAALRDVHGRDARLVIAGAAKFVDRATRFDNVAYLSELQGLTRNLGVATQVSFVGERDDVPDVMQALDVLLVPSWEEPFGRSVIEAMAMKVPVVASTPGGPAEIITDGVEGRLLPARSPDEWAAALDAMLADDERLAAMGTAGRSRALDFSVERHVDQTLATYAEVAARAASKPAAAALRAPA